MTKTKIVLYKPDGHIKEYADVTVIEADVGLIRFLNNQNHETIVTTLPYTVAGIREGEAEV